MAIVLHAARAFVSIFHNYAIKVKYSCTSAPYVITASHEYDKLFSRRSCSHRLYQQYFLTRFLYL